MDINPDYQLLIEEFATSMGAKPEINEDSTFALNVEQLFDINFAYVEKEHSVLMVAHIKELEDEQQHKIAKQAFCANYGYFTSGVGAFGLTPDGTTLVYSVKSPLTSLDISQLSAVVKEIIDVSFSWWHKLQNTSGQEPAPNEIPHTPPPFFQGITA